MTVTLRQLRTQKGLSTKEMSSRLGMPIKEYIRAENGTPPLWMKRAIHFFQACFDLGYLPENIFLQEREDKGALDAIAPGDDLLTPPGKTT